MVLKLTRIFPKSNIIGYLRVSQQADHHWLQTPNLSPMPRRLVLLRSHPQNFLIPQDRLDEMWPSKGHRLLPSYLGQEGYRESGEQGTGVWVSPFISQRNAHTPDPYRKHTY